MTRLDGRHFDSRYLTEQGERERCRRRERCVRGTYTILVLPDLSADRTVEFLHFEPLENTFVAEFVSMITIDEWNIDRFLLQTDAADFQAVLIEGR